MASDRESSVVEAAKAAALQSRGRTPAFVQILFADGTLSGPVPVAVTTVSRREGVGAEILQILRDVGHRLTQHQILGELDQRGMKAADSTVKGMLSSMVQGGELTNNQAVNPKGYGLPEWGSDDDTVEG